MKIVALIPARLHSTRLPQKLLQTLGNKSVLATTYANAKATQLFDEVICIADDAQLQQEIEKENGNCYLSTQTYETGSDRIAAFATAIEADIFINIQADEPFVNKEILQQLITAFNNPAIQVATLMYAISELHAHNPNYVKVVPNAHNYAITFSRSIIPFNRSKVVQKYYKHIGIYAFRKNALIQFAQLPQPDIEKAECLENLRFIYNGIPVFLIETNYTPIGIDTAEDLENARQYLKKV
jgi:3-deoxy-manno-octulosonate cytidylyltransferase (CMP-KDO synthetase)